jgi:hypothetical protein
MRTYDRAYLKSFLQSLEAAQQYRSQSESETVAQRLVGEKFAAKENQDQLANGLRIWKRSSQIRVDKRPSRT